MDISTETEATHFPGTITWELNVQENLDDVFQYSGVGDLAPTGVLRRQGTVGSWAFPFFVRFNAHDLYNSGLGNHYGHACDTGFFSGSEVEEQSCAPLRVLADSEHASAAIDRKQRALANARLIQCGRVVFLGNGLTDRAAVAVRRGHLINGVGLSVRDSARETSIKDSARWPFSSASVLTMRETATRGRREAGTSISGRRAELCRVLHVSLSIVGLPRGKAAVCYVVSSAADASGNVCWVCWVAEWTKQCSCSVRVLGRGHLWASLLLNVPRRRSASSVARRVWKQCSDANARLGSMIRVQVPRLCPELEEFQLVAANPLTPEGAGPSGHLCCGTSSPGVV